MNKHLLFYPIIILAVGAIAWYGTKLIGDNAVNKHKIQQLQHS